jgi:signal transduction histidine kinase
VVAAGAVATAAALYRELLRRAELVARACHEVRGPLTAALLGVRLVGRPGESAAARAVALELELRRAARALGDLEAAGEGSRGRDERDPVDVGALLRQAVAAWELLAEAAGVTLRVRALPSNAVVRGDRVRLAQACGNLVANAIEHGGGEVELRARADGRRVRIEVRDRGRGLPAPVADLAARARAGRGRRGRGLAIAADVAARHGGRLSAAPSPAGACLALELPLARPAVGAGDEHAPAEPSTDPASA